MKTQENIVQENQTKKKKSFFPFLLYPLCFYTIWLGWVYLIYPLLQALDTTTLTYALINSILRLLIWVVPIFLYLHLIDHVKALDYLKLKQYWKRGIIVGLAVSLLNFFLTIIRFGPPHFNIHALTWNSVISTSLLIGFVEEIPFRGFIFQKLREKYPFWLANLLSSLLFLGIHLPGWFALHVFTWGNALSIFVIGALLATIFYYTRSLWSSIIVHSLNDFISGILFHLS